MCRTVRPVLSASFGSWPLQQHLYQLRQQQITDKSWQPEARFRSPTPHMVSEWERVYFPLSNNNWISTQQKCKIRRVARKALGPSKLATHDELLPGGGVVSWEMMEVRALIVHIGCQCICPCRANLHKWGFAQSLSYHRPCTTLLTSASAGPCANNLHLIPDR